MIGIILAVVASLLFTLSDLGKKALSHTLSPSGVIFSSMTCGLITNGAYLVFFQPTPLELGPAWLLLGFCALGAIAGELLFMHGIRQTDLSLAKPLSAVFPVFATIIAYLFFDEVPSVLGGLGVATIVLGAYLLGTKPPFKRNLMLPIYLLRRQRGCQMMLLAAFIGAAIMVAQKHAAPNTSGILFFTLMLCIDWIIFGFLVWRHGFLLPGATLSRFTIPITLASGILWGVAGALAYSAFNYALSAYIAAALQIGVLLAIILGGVVLKEKDIKYRLFASCIMLIGICMVALGAD
jgi:drug/metabolite transporter (DMT)-like permease